MNKNFKEWNKLIDGMDDVETRLAHRLLGKGTLAVFLKGNLVSQIKILNKHCISLHPAVSLLGINPKDIILDMCKDLTAQGC